MTAAQLVAILEVQDLDTAVDQHVHRLAHLPEAQAVADLDAAAAAITARSATLRVLRDEVAGRQKVFEDELAATEARSKTVSARLYGGTVSASRDLQAMAADIEALRSRASTLEDHVLEVLEEREPLDASLEAADEELAALAGRRVVADEARVVAAAGLSTELEELRSKRETAAHSVPTALLADYDQIRAHNGGIGAARLVGARCGGCHLTLSAMELDKVRHGTGDVVVHCEECERILVRTS